MAYGLYYFLLSLPVEDAKIDGDLHDMAEVACADFFANNCDVDADPEMIFVALKDGRKLLFPDPDDEEQRNKSYEELYTDAVDRVVTAIEPSIVPELEGLDNKTKMLHAVQAGGKAVAYAYLLLAGYTAADTSSHPEMEQLESEAWYRCEQVRRVIASHVDLLASSLHEERHPPFVTPYSDRTPYDYPAFDLTNGKEPNAILVACIHI